MFLVFGAVGTLLVASLWIYLARTRPVFLLPVYLLASIPPLPGAAEILLFPDLGVGLSLTREFPTPADVLLLVTVLSVAEARRRLLRGLPLLLVGLSLITIANAWVLQDHPAGVVLLLGINAARIGCAWALFSWAGSRDASGQMWSAALVITALLFVGAAGVFLVGRWAGLDEQLRAVGLLSDVGRLSFPRLGNNKIALALLLVTTAFVVSRPRRGLFAHPAVLVGLLISGAVVCAIGDLRFGTTAFFVIFLVHLLSTRSWALIAVPVLAVVAVTGVVVTSPAMPRALSVLSGDFDLLHDSSLQSRLDIWEGAVRVWQQSPVIGHLAGWEYDRPVERADLLTPLETHSDYLWWLSSYGAVGLVLFAALAVVLLRGSLRSSQPVVAGAAALSTLGALALNAASFFPITGVCLAAALYSAERSRSPHDRPASPVAPTQAVRRLAWGRSA